MQIGQWEANPSTLQEACEVCRVSSTALCKEQKESFLSSLSPPPEGQASKLHFVFCWGVEWNDLPSPYLRHHRDDLRAPHASIHLVVWSSCHKACVKPAVPGGGGLAAGRCQFMRVGSVDRASFTALWFTQTSKSDDFLGGCFFFGAGAHGGLYKSSSCFDLHLWLPLPLFPPSGNCVLASWRGRGVLVSFRKQH